MHCLHQYANYNIQQKGEELCLYSTIHKVLYAHILIRCWRGGAKPRKTRCFWKGTYSLNCETRSGDALV